jgi:DNA-binding MarR family transcriptional regulator
MAMDAEVLIDEAVELLPQIGKVLYAAISKQPEASGLTMGQIKALVVIYHQGSSTVSDLATGIGVALPTASEMVERLVERGLVVREADPDDRRRVRLTLTPTAGAFGDRIRDLRRCQVQRALDRLDPTEWPVFLRSLRALAEALAIPTADLTKEWAADAPPPPVGAGTA